MTSGYTSFEYPSSITSVSSNLSVLKSNILPWWFKYSSLSLQASFLLYSPYLLTKLVTQPRIGSCLKIIHVIHCTCLQIKALQWPLVVTIRSKCNTSIYMWSPVFSNNQVVSHFILGPTIFLAVLLTVNCCWVVVFCGDNSNKIPKVYEKSFNHRYIL